MSTQFTKRASSKRSVPITTKRSESASRKDRGSMQVLACALFVFVAIGLLIAFSYGGLFFIQNRLRTSADEIALAGARKLNDQDRIGQMNNMIARSRQLVYSSREQLEEATEKYPQMEPLAQQLLEESREQALLLEQQRKALRNTAIAEANTAMQQKFDEIKNTYPMALPWLKVGIAEMPYKKLGKINDMQTNVEALKNLEELEEQDASKGYVHNSPNLKLYKDSIDAKLPGADGDLTFKMCPLPAPVEKTVSPARLVLYKKYKPSDADHLPTAAQVKLRVKIATGLGAGAESQMEAVGTASATGASVQQ